MFAELDLTHVDASGNPVDLGSRYTHVIDPVAKDVWEQARRQMDALPGTRRRRPRGAGVCPARRQQAVQCPFEAELQRRDLPGHSSPKRVEAVRVRRPWIAN